MSSNLKDTRETSPNCLNVEDIKVPMSWNFLNMSWKMSPPMSSFFNEDKIGNFRLRCLVKHRWEWVLTARKFCRCTEGSNYYHTWNAEITHNDRGNLRRTSLIWLAFYPMERWFYIMGENRNCPLSKSHTCNRLKSMFWSWE